MRPTFIIFTIAVSLCALPASVAAQHRTARSASGMTAPQLPQPPAASSDTLHDRVQDRPGDAQLPTPTGLTNTNDYAQCTQHGGLGAGFACKASLPGGSMALIWQYPPRVQIIGFHIYILGITDPHRLLVDTQALGAATTIAIMDPQAPNPARCYAVTAFTASEESDLSNLFCDTTGAHLMRKINLLPNWRSSGLLNVTKRNEVPRSPSTPMVGYAYNTDRGITASGDAYVNFALRTGMMFDVTSLKGQQIVSATLKMEVNRTWTNRFMLDDGGAATTDSLPDSHTKSCTAKFFLGGDRWTNNADWIEAGALIAETGVADGPDISIDVTKTVRAWASGKENRGFVLEGEEENLTAFTEGACVTQYLPESLQLTVVSY